MILSDNFRNEILRDWVNDMFAREGLGQSRLAEGRLEYDAIDGIIRVHAARYNLPYVVMTRRSTIPGPRGTVEAEYNGAR
jgi:hypothetical protein